MKNSVIVFLLLFFIPSRSLPAQVTDSLREEIAFISDTQAPMCVEKIFLKSNQNTLATELLFRDITLFRPRCLFILGDVVSKGPREKKWLKMDQYLASARASGIPVYALLGNHDVMGSAKKGEFQFNKRFPDQVNTGFLKIVDSVAVVLLNSNFKTLSLEKQKQQQDFYARTLADLDADPAVRCVIVTCHHPPYSNSTIVGSNKTVQEQFVPLFQQSKKARLFMTGHAHDFEYFRFGGKYFLTIGGGGGLHQPLNTGKDRLPNEAGDYNPEFQYVLIKRTGTQLNITSKRLKTDFSGMETGYSFVVE